MLSETCTQAATYQSEAQNISAQAETSTTVSTFDDFFKALGKYKHIIVAKSFQTAASSDKNGQTFLPTLLLRAKTALQSELSAVVLFS